VFAWLQPISNFQPEDSGQPINTRASLRTKAFVLNMQNTGQSAVHLQWDCACTFFLLHTPATASARYSAERVAMQQAPLR
jgi:hypothetical protein